MLKSAFRCSNCFDCPVCGHTLMTRATSQMVTNPEDPGKSTPKKMYYMACGFCRWTTRDVGLHDQSVGMWYISFKLTYQSLVQQGISVLKWKSFIRLPWKVIIFFLMTWLTSLVYIWKTIFVKTNLYCFFQLMEVGLNKKIRMLKG